MVTVEAGWTVVRASAENHEYQTFSTNEAYVPKEMRVNDHSCIGPMLWKMDRSDK